MSNWRHLFNTGSSITAAPIVTGASNSINLRREFNDLIDGTGGDTPIGQRLILRRMRRDSDGALIPCFCRNETTGEALLDYPCSSCGGGGFLWDEELVVGYKVIAASPGDASAAANSPKESYGVPYLRAARFYFKYNLVPNIRDRVIEIELDEAGNPIVPYNRIQIFELTLVRDMRSDRGQIDFWVCNAESMGPPTRGVVT